MLLRRKLCDESLPALYICNDVVRMEKSTVTFVINLNLLSCNSATDTTPQSPSLGNPLEEKPGIWARSDYYLFID